MKKIVILLILIIETLAPTKINAMNSSNQQGQSVTKTCQDLAKPDIIRIRIKSMQKSISSFLEKHPKRAANITDSFIKILKELTELKKQINTPAADLEEIELIVSLRENELKLLQKSPSLYKRFISGVNSTSSFIWYFSGTTLLACIKNAITQIPKQRDTMQSVLVSNATAACTNTLTNTEVPLPQTIRTILPGIAFTAWMLYNIYHDAKKS